MSKKKSVDVIYFNLGYQIHLFIFNTSNVCTVLINFEILIGFLMGF